MVNMKLIWILLLFAPLPALAWDGYEFSTNKVITIPEGQEVAEGREVIFYISGNGAHHTAIVTEIAYLGGAIKLILDEGDSKREAYMDIERSPDLYAAMIERQRSIQQAIDNNLRLRESAEQGDPKILLSGEYAAGAIMSGEKPESIAAEYLRLMEEKYKNDPQNPELIRARQALAIISGYRD